MSRIHGPQSAPRSSRARWNAVAAFTAIVAVGTLRHDASPSRTFGASGAAAASPDRTVAADARALFLPYAAQRIVPRLVPIAQLGGTTAGVTYVEPYVYLGAGRRLLVVDVADAGAPRIAGQGDLLPGIVAAVSPVAGYLLVDVAAGARTGDDLLVVDIADPLRPAVAGTVTLPEPVVDLAVAGARAYAATPNAGLFVLDVADPARVRIIGRVAYREAFVDVVAGDHYVALTEAELYPELQTQRVLDVREPAHIAQVAELRRDNFLPGSAFVGDHLYSASQGGVSVHAPPAFAAVDGLSDMPPGSAIAVRGARAYVLNGYRSGRFTLAVLDVSRPERPTRIDRCDTDADSAARCELLASGATATETGWLYASGGAPGRAGLHVVDVRDVRYPRVAGSLDLLGGVGNALWLDGATLVVADQDARVARLLDVSAPERPRLVGELPLPSHPEHLAVQGGLAYRLDVDRNALEVVDVRAPDVSSPVGALTWGDRRSLSHVAWQGDVALVGWTLDGHGSMDGARLSVIDAGAPAAPVETASAGPFAGELRALLLDEHVGYAVTSRAVRTADGWATWSFLHVLDVSRPTAPSVVAELGLDIGIANSVALCRRTLVLSRLSDGSDADVVVDVRDPTHPRLVGRVWTSTAPGWVCTGDTAFAVQRGADDGYGIAVLDLTDPARPQTVGWFPGIGGRLVGDARHLYVGDAGGVTVLRIERGVRAAGASGASRR